MFLEACSTTKSDNLIFAGDWNTVLNNNLDKAGGAAVHNNVNCQTLLNNIMGDWGFSDVFRLNNPAARLYTHFDKQHSTHTRLDFFLVDDKLINLPVCSSNISHGFSSDHSYVSLNLQGNPLSHGRGYWKFNNSHLHSEEFTQEVREIIKDTVSGSYDSFNGLWDTIKYRVKDYSIYYGKKTKKYKSAEKKIVMDRIEDIKKTPNYQESLSASEALLQLQERLDKILRVEMEGVIMRSKAQFVEKGERCTKYFFGLEKNRGKKKIINKLVDELTDETLLTQEDISSHAVSFYQNLYTTKGNCRSDVESYLDGCPLPEIPELLSDKLDQPITLEEVEEVVKYLKKNKSPGWDGLSAEFYQYFWEDIKHTIFHSYLESIRNNCLSPSQRIGVINLIPKPKPPSDLVYLKNWRPITLLNVDYKIFTHVIKNRFVDSLPHVISKVQSGFQSGRCTSDNLVLMCLVLEHFNNNEEDEGGLILQVDFEKAFDSVDHYFLFKTMERLGFGSFLINLVKIAFHGCLSFININGHLSSQVYLGRGLHQGSPLSPILFLLIAQVFTAKLECNQSIHGISVNGVDLLLSLFADDTDMFLKASGRCLDEVMKEIRKFGKITGCKNNLDKTKCIPLGSAKHDVNLISHINNTYGNSIITKQFSALGVSFNNSSCLQDISDINFSNKLDKAKSRAKFWINRDLTIYGRVTLIKSLLMAQFVYISTSMLRPSSKIVKDITTFIFNFLWGVKCDRIKRNIVTQTRGLGGLVMFYPLDFLSSMKLKLLQKIGDSNFNHKWKDIVLRQVRYPEHPGICFENGLVNRVHSFTHDLVNSYSEWKNNSAKFNDKCINHCIWENGLITDIGSKLWVPKLINYNIVYLSDFVNKQGEVMTYQEFCIETLDRCWHIISKSEYVNLRMAIRSFLDPNIPHRNPCNIDPQLCLNFFTGDTAGNLKASKIRDLGSSKLDCYDILALQNWAKDLGTDPIDWSRVFMIMYGGFTKNFKLLQFQYKLLMRISTCRYMRYKMKIDINSPNCIYCTSKLETLRHIFLDCPRTIPLIIYLEYCIMNNLDANYNDPNKIFYVTCSHDNPYVNFIWAAFKLYISRSFQLFKEPCLKGLENYFKSIFHGETEATISNVKLALSLQD